MSTYTSRLRVTPSDTGISAYGPVEITWYPDRLEITALGAGRASVTEEQVRGEDVVLAVRPAKLDELVEALPGAD
jgi:hypothetical protein